MVRVGSTDGVHGGYGEGDSSSGVSQGKNPREIKVFNNEELEKAKAEAEKAKAKIEKKRIAAQNKINELKNKPHSEKEMLKACGGDKELFDALVKAGYVEKTSDGQYKISGLSDAFAEFSNPVNNSIDKASVKDVLLGVLGGGFDDRISDKQAKKLAKLCGFSVKNEGLRFNDIINRLIGMDRLIGAASVLNIKLAGAGSVLNSQEISKDITIKSGPEAAKDFSEQFDDENIIVQLDGKNVKITVIAGDDNKDGSGYIHRAINALGFKADELSVTQTEDGYEVHFKSEENAKKFQEFINKASGEGSVLNSQEIRLNVEG